MADRDASPPPNTRARISTAGPHLAHQPSDHGPPRQDLEKPGGRDATAGLMRSGLARESSMFAARSSDEMVDVGARSKIPRLSLPSAQDLSRQHSKSSVLRPARPRSSAGGFLLSDPTLEDLRRESTPSSSRRSHRTNHDARRSRLPSPQASDKSDSRGAYLRDALQSPSTSDQGDAIHTRQSSSPNSTSALSNMSPVGESSLPRGVLAVSVAGPASPRPASAMASPLDTDSAQIVNMALNLSEKRRLAARRNTSQPLPPRLLPLPENSMTSNAGGGLKQHLQRQRVSRTLSPRPDGPPSRLPVAVPPQRTVNSPSQPPHEHGAHDGMSMRYHFSKSTLARAQKAKDYMELLAQYRRLLKFVPSLRHPAQLQGRPSTASPPGSPIDGRKSFEYPGRASADLKLGRPYNPLQYIRNRKVRARERKTISGEEQGFADIERVSEWVNDVEVHAATSQQTQTPEEMASLPPFATADESFQTGSPPSSKPRPVATGSKPKRPRMDWTIDPAEMIADLYWLEQGDNKKMLEDRHWTRVYPQDEDAFRPRSRQQTTPQHGSPASTKETLHTRTSADFKRTRGSDLTAGGSDMESVSITAHERTHQKLRALKGIHRHQANGSLGRGRDFLRIRRGDVSDSSDTDNERRLRTRTGTISSSSQDLLHKQMMDMLAEEQREAEESHPLYNPETHQMMSGATNANAISMAPPQEKPQPSSQIPSRMPSAHHRTDSPTIEKGEKDMIRSLSPPQQALVDRGRASLEVPEAGGLWQRHTADPYDTPQPTSPEMRPVRGVEGIGVVPAIGNVDITPVSSRPASPARKPFHRMKEILTGDRSNRERAAEPRILVRHLEERDRPDLAASTVTPPTKEKARMRFPSHERQSSRSPIRKTVTRGTDLSQASSKHRRGDEKDGSISSIMGLRNVLRGPNRIDNALRSGVSRVGDLLWRGGSGGSKDFEQFAEGKEAAQDTDTSSEQPDVEKGDALVRGRSDSISHQSASRGRTTTVSQPGQSQGGRHFLDIMPQFRPVSQDGGKRAGVTEPGSLTVSAPGSASPSRKSSRFDLLKPPRLDVKVAGDDAPRGMSLSPPPELRPTGRRLSRAGVSSDPSDTMARAELLRKGPESNRMAVSETLQAANASLKKAIFSTTDPVDITSDLALSSNGRPRASSSVDQSGGNADRASSVMPIPATALWSGPTRRELARLRTLLLSTGIQAMEMERRAREDQLLLTPPPSSCGTSIIGNTPPWTSCHLAEGRELAASVQQAAAAWGSRVEALEGTESPALWARMDAIRVRVEGTAAAVGNTHEAFSHDDGGSDKAQDDAEEDSDADGFALGSRLGLAGRARWVAELADEALAPDTGMSAGAVRLGAKRAGDAIEALLRRRRRRFRWARRAGWLAVEWVLIGCMWYVWFMVMMARVAMGIVGALVAAVRWLVGL